MEGTWDEAKKTLSYIGDSDNPCKPAGKVNRTIRVENKDKTVTEM